MLVGLALLRHSRAPDPAGSIRIAPQPRFAARIARQTLAAPGEGPPATPQAWDAIMADAVEPPPPGLVAPVVGGVKALDDGSASPDGKGGLGRSSFRQRKLNRLSGGAKRKYDPFEEPLPISYRATADGRAFEKLALPPDALASSWRDYNAESTVSSTHNTRPKPPGLFDTVPVSRSPHDLLVANTRSTQPKVVRQRDAAIVLLAGAALRLD